MPVNTLDEKGLPPSPPKPLASWYAQGLSDGLGDRLLMFDNSTAPSLELLRFRPEIARIPGFETALRHQVSRLHGFRHPAFVPVRAIQRLEPDDDLALISNCTPGRRLSEVLHRAQGPAFAATLIRQLAPALVALQQHDTGISHGVLSPDRIVVSPEGALTIVEHVVGPAIETLALRPSDLAALGIALPPAADAAAPRLDVATDWYQLGLVAVSVLLGRPVTAGELPQLETLLQGLPPSVHPDGPVLSPFIRQWLERALQISGNRIASDAEARAALDELLREEQSRDSRRIDSVRYDPAAASASPAATCPPQLADSPPDFAQAMPVLDTATLRAAGNGDPRAVKAPVGPTPVAPTPMQPPILGVSEPTEVHPHAPEVRGSSDQGALSLFEAEQEAEAKRADSVKRSTLHDRPVVARPPVPDRPAATQPPVAVRGGAGGRGEARRLRETSDPPRSAGANTASSSRSAGGSTTVRPRSAGGNSASCRPSARGNSAPSPEPARDNTASLLRARGGTASCPGSAGGGTASFLQSGRGKAGHRLHS